MRILGISALLLVGMVVAGCGSNEIKLPSDKLTKEQEEQIKKDDAKVADEESHGAKRR